MAQLLRRVAAGAQLLARRIMGVDDLRAGSTS